MPRDGVADGTSQTVETISVRAKVSARFITWDSSVLIHESERQIGLGVTRAPGCLGEGTVLVGNGTDRVALRAAGEQVLGHSDTHLGRDVHVDVFVKALTPAGDEVLEAHELLHDG